MEGQGKEWSILEKVALESFKEQRRARRWSIFFKLLTFAYLFVGIGLLVSGSSSLNIEANRNDAHTAIVRIHGAIMDDQDANAGMINESLRKAFENENSKAVVLAINSPGGSPVHAGYVYDEIVRLRVKYPEKKIYAVISDLGASAAYYIAAATDEIYADKASLVGSIGVISSSFGFTDVIKKIGVERRVFTSGDNKAFLDPFQPLKPEEKAFWQETLLVVHKQFIEQVKIGRGDRLQDDDEIFSGFIWTGEQALDKGLIDGMGSVRSVARDIVGVEELVDYSFKRSPLDSFMKQIGASVAKQIAIEFGVRQSVPRMY